MSEYLTAENVAIALGLLVGLEQVLASIPSVKSNSTFQLICNVTEKIVSLVKK